MAGLLTYINAFYLINLIIYHKFLLIFFIFYHLKHLDKKLIIGAIWRQEAQICKCTTL